MADGDDGSDQPSDTLRERAEESRWKLWLLMEADRWMVTVVLVAVVFATLTASGYLYPTAETAIRTSSSIDYVFQAYLTATITGVTLVLTLNQLVLSQELGSVGDQRERMQGAMEFRKDASDLINSRVSPARPAQFLRGLVQVSGQRADDLRTAVSDNADEDLRRAVDDLVDSLTGNADEVTSGLDGAQFGKFEVVSSALNFNYSWKLFTARRIRQQFGESLDEKGEEALDRLVEVLTLFGPAREHFKTLYFQWELINLSRAILTAAVPALLVSAFMLMFFNVKTFAWTVAGHSGLILAMTVTITVATAPFLILLAYVMRIATVTKHTLSIGPFILRETDQVEEVEWNRDPEPSPGDD